MFWTMGTVFFAKKRCSTRTASGSAHRGVSCWCHKCYIWHYYSKEEYWCQGFRSMNELWGKNSGDTGALLSSPFMTKKRPATPAAAYSRTIRRTHIRFLTENHQSHRNSIKKEYSCQGRFLTTVNRMPTIWRYGQLISTQRGKQVDTKPQGIALLCLPIKKEARWTRSPRGLTLSRLPIKLW